MFNHKDLPTSPAAHPTAPAGPLPQLPQTDPLRLVTAKDGLDDARREANWRYLRSAGETYNRRVAESHDRSDGGLLSDNSRKWRDFRYVYPVLSRRGKGLSLGVNLNPDKNCSFSCIYCQVRREAEPVVGKVDTAILGDGLTRT